MNTTEHINLRDAVIPPFRSEIRMPLGETREKAQGRKGPLLIPLLIPKHKLRIGNWNVRTLLQTGNAAQVATEMEKQRIELMGISETHWTGHGKIQINDGMSIIYLGRDDEIHREGVAIMMTKEAGDALIDWVPINERIIKATFFSRHIKLTVIHTYAPTEGADEQTKDKFYEKFQVTIQQVNKHDLLIVTGDMNAKVGNDNENYEQVMGKQGIGTRNENGSRLCEMCDMNDLVITGTIFPHRHIHLATWKSPDSTTLNQIDHTIVNKRFRN